MADEMTPEQTIKGAWRKAPAWWPGMENGVPIRVVPRIPLTATAPVELYTPAEATFEPVEFVYQEGTSQMGRPVFRVQGTYKGVTITVASGPRE